MTRRTVLWVGIVVVVVVAVAFVGVRIWGASGGPTEEPVPIAGADLSGSGPGSLVSAMTMPAYERQARGMKAARVVYRSTPGDGQPAVVSGSVFIPDGDAPDGGWPVISFGHGTTGIDEPCAPSLSASLLGYDRFVVALIGKGYAVAFADFQGLGAPGVHPYTDSRTAGLNMIDAVRALRATFKNVSNRWGAYGGSQGGGAAWAADEQARTYAPELELVGAATISPVTDLTGLVDKSQRGALTSDQVGAGAEVIESLARLHADIELDDYRRGAAARYWDALVACQGPKLHDRKEAIEAVGAHDVGPTTTEAADRLRKYLEQWALPQQPLSAALLVWYGGTDTFVDQSWTAEAIQRACALGGTVVVQFEADKGHSQANYVDQLSWLTERFAGTPATNDCA